MIIKICEEMRDLRIKNDYRNYRNLVNILRDYAYDLIRNPLDYIQLKKEEYEVKTEPIKTLEKWVKSEIGHVTELLNSSLGNKNYGDFKILSQSDLVLKGIHNRIKDSRIL